MPELPEVETIAVGVNERVCGERILSVRLSRYKEPFKTPRSEMAEVLTGAKIGRVYRVGKHIVFDMIDARGVPFQWVVHLGMTGRLLVSQSGVPVPTHTHAQLVLGGDHELRFVDARRFGRLLIHYVEHGQGFCGSGREPLTISEKDFAALFHGRKLSIKAALLNQSLLEGVGNIYADESLFRAGIRPTTPAGRLSRVRLARLRGALQEILRRAIEMGGSSVSDYVDADGVAGFFQLEHRVYRRTGQPCMVCGHPIHRVVLAGRGTHFCLHCQRR